MMAIYVSLKWPANADTVMSGKERVRKGIDASGCCILVENISIRFGMGILGFAILVALKASFGNALWRRGGV